MADSCHTCHSDRKTLFKCSKCKSASYCSAACQKKHWPIHKPMCQILPPNQVWGIRLLENSKVDGGQSCPIEKRMEHQIVPSDAIVFRLNDICPVTAQCGIPLIIYSPGVHNGDPKASGNQPAVYLRIEVEDGLAPLQWQTLNAGSCTVVREDKKPLTKEVLETVYAFQAAVLSSFGYPVEDGWASPVDLVRPAVFQMFSRDYYKKQNEKGRIGFSAFFSPL